MYIGGIYWVVFSIKVFLVVFISQMGEVVPFDEHT